MLPKGNEPTKEELLQSKLLDNRNHGLINYSLSFSKHDSKNESKIKNIPKIHDQYEPSKIGWCAQFFSLSYNIRMILIWTLFWGASTSIWTRQVLSTYVYQISGNSTVTLGFIEAAQGISYLVSSPIAGILTDKVPRIYILRLSGIIGLLIAAPLGVFVLLIINNNYHRKYEFMYYVWLCVWGICACFSTTVINTIFADLIPKGKRDFIFSFQWFIRRMASTLGPIIVVLMFYFLGNDWKISEMNIVLISGLGLWCVPLLLTIFAFRKSELQSIEEQQFISNEKDDVSKSEPSLTSVSLKENNNIIKNSENYGDRQGKKEEKQSKYIDFVPWLLIIHRIIVATGAGMTVKFFPIFFEKKIGLKPIALNSIYVVTPFTIAMFTILVERCASKCHRIFTIILFKTFGIICLLAMATITKNMTKYADEIIVGTYVLRTACQNCAFPIEKSVLMDHVKPKNRGKWSAVENVQATVWTFSAAAGGYLISIVGYRKIYYITASIYALATTILIPVMLITK